MIKLLLLNRTLIRMSKGLWGWILTIAGLKMVTLMGTASFAQIISGFLGSLDSPEMTGGPGRVGGPFCFCDGGGDLPGRAAHPGAGGVTAVTAKPAVAAYPYLLQGIGAGCGQH